MLNKKPYIRVFKQKSDQILKIEIIKKDFFKHSLTLFSGSFIAQLIPLIITPVLTRMYSEELFGILFIYSSLCLVVSIIASLRYELAIVLPESDEEAANILVLCFVITAIISSLVLFIVILFSNQIVKLLGNEQIKPWLYLLPISVFFIGIYQSCIFWFNRKKKYTPISVGNVTRTATTGGTQLGLGFYKYQNFGLISGLIFGQIAYSLVLLAKLSKELPFIIKSTSRIKIIQYLKKYKDIPVFNTAISFLNALSFHMPVFIITRFYGIITAGLYGMSYRLLSYPAQTISTAIGQVFYKEANDKILKKESIFHIVKKIYIRLFLVAVIPLTIVAIWGPDLFKLILGNEWLLAGKYSQLLTPWILVMFLNTPFSYLITLLNKQRPLTFYYLFELIAKFLSIFIGYKLYQNIIYSLFFMSITGFVFNACLMIYYFVITKKNRYSLYK